MSKRGASTVTAANLVSPSPVPTAAVPTAAVPTAAVPQPPRPTSGWIFSPLEDMLFFANLWWIVLGLPWALAADGESVLSIYQIYFLTTPHRWITLLLVATDSDRREGRERIFIGLAVLAAAIVGGVAWFSDGKALPCLFLMDLVWNTWHFGSQHAGILRIYSGKTGGGRRTLETYALRILVVYVMLSLVGWLTEWASLLGSWTQYAWTLDLLVLAPAASLIVLELADRPWERLGKVVYLLSVVGLYLSLLAALRWHIQSWLLPLATCGAAFHAVEYLAIVTYYAKRRVHHGSPNVFQTLANYWMVVFLAYVLLVGTFSLALDRRVATVWAAINVWAAYLHYAYDGMIWKLRRAATAETLGTQSGVRQLSQAARS